MTDDPNEQSDRREPYFGDPGWLREQTDGVVYEVSKLHGLVAEIVAVSVKADGALEAEALRPGGVELLRGAGTDAEWFFVILVSDPRDPAHPTVVGQFNRSELLAD